jgi:hypothetical protein
MYIHGNMSCNKLRKSECSKINECKWVVGKGCKQANKTPFKSHKKSYMFLTEDMLKRLRGDKESEALRKSFLDKFDNFLYLIVKFIARKKDKGLDIYGFDKILTAFTSSNWEEHTNDLKEGMYGEYNINNALSYEAYGVRPVIPGFRNNYYSGKHFEKQVAEIFGLNRVDTTTYNLLGRALSYMFHVLIGEIDVDYTNNEETHSFYQGIHFDMALQQNEELSRLCTAINYKFNKTNTHKNIQSFPKSLIVPDEMLDRGYYQEGSVEVSYRGRDKINDFFSKVVMYIFRNKGTITVYNRGEIQSEFSNSDWPELLSSMDMPYKYTDNRPGSLLDSYRDSTPWSSNKKIQKNIRQLIGDVKIPSASLTAVINVLEAVFMEIMMCPYGHVADEDDFFIYKCINSNSELLALANAVGWPYIQ